MGWFRFGGLQDRSPHTRPQIYDAESLFGGHRHSSGGAVRLGDIVIHSRRTGPRDPTFRWWQGSLDYSWGFRREGGRLLGRLDRFYVNDWAIGRGGQVGMVSGTTLSDHAPVIMTLDSAVQSLPPRSCRILDSIFTREEVRSRIISLWDRVG